MAPEFIARDDNYAGPYTIEGVPTDMIAGRATAGTVAEYVGTEGVLWESFGKPFPGRPEHFARTRFVADDEGNLHCYASDGHKVIIHPAARTLRILTFPV